MNKKTFNEMKKWLTYNPETGYVAWIKTKSNAAKKGNKVQTMSHGYIVFKFNRKSYPAHRFAWAFYHGEIPDKYIDHINGKKDDNRISNLRNVSMAENLINQKKHRMGHLPYTTKKGNKWQSQAQGKYIGIFKYQKEAHKQALEQVEKILGDG
jgi:hypothetical protein